jgi:putative transposase
MKKKRWRDESLRLKHYDYGANGGYFVTLNTKNRVPYFGSVVAGRMVYSPIGQLANDFWKEIPKHFPFVELDEFIVMPDHIHGILVINKKKEDNFPSPSSSLPPGGMPKLGIPTDTREEEGEGKLIGTPKKGGHRPEWKPGTLGVILNQYKRICTIHARKINPFFAWQVNFHDRVIWDDRGYYFIGQYIRDNPKNWKG